MLRGSMVALVTPMHGSGEVDYDALARLVDFHVANGTDAIVAVGTTGESPTLDTQEHCEVIRKTVELANGRIPVIGGTGSNSTHEAIELTRCAQRSGVDACLVVTPYYNKPTQQGMYLHFQAIAQAVDVPIILYNVPGRTVSDLMPETVIRLAKLPNIVGIKEATGEVDRVAAIAAGSGPDFAIYSGDDATARALMLAGGHGVISVTANVAPKAMHEMCIAAMSGDAARAELIDRPLAGLHTDLFLEANPIPVKWALHTMALIPGGIRLPLTPLSSQYHDAVRRALAEAGVIQV